MVTDDGSEINSESFNGKWVVIYFYPKDDTPVCTKEAQTFSAMLEDFGVNMIAGFCARDSVLINPKGEFRAVSPSSHPGEILVYIVEHSK